MFSARAGGSGAGPETEDSPLNAAASSPASGSKIELRKGSLSEFKVFVQFLGITFCIKLICVIDFGHT